MSKQINIYKSVFIIFIFFIFFDIETPAVRLSLLSLPPLSLSSHLSLWRDVNRFLSRGTLTPTLSPSCPDNRVMAEMVLPLALKTHFFDILTHLPMILSSLCASPSLSSPAEGLSSSLPHHQLLLLQSCQALPLTSVKTENIQNTKCLWSVDTCSVLSNFNHTSIQDVQKVYTAKNIVHNYLGNKRVFCH